MEGKGVVVRLATVTPVHPSPSSSHRVTCTTLYVGRESLSIEDVYGDGGSGVHGGGRRKGSRGRWQGKLLT